MNDKQIAALFAAMIWERMRYDASGNPSQLIEGGCTLADFEQYRDERLAEAGLPGWDAMRAIWDKMRANPYERKPFRSARIANPIKVRYSSIDGVREARSYKSIAAARKFAQRMVGAHPEMGYGYAVSGDGVGKITIEGASLSDLFPEA